MNPGVLGRFFQEPNDMVEGLIREVEDSILFRNSVENRGGILQGWVLEGLESLPNQVIMLPRLRELKEILEAVVPTTWHQIIILQFKALFHERDERIGCLEVIEEATGKARVPFPQALPDLGYQVAFELILQVEVGVPGELHSIGGAHFEVGKNVL
jgi:hypothetical protein